MQPHTFLLTYNPTYWVWPHEQRTAHTMDRWNVGTRRQGVQPGDHLYVLQQGPHPRGLLAHGIATTQIYQDDHWDNVPGHLGNYVDLQWTYVAHNPMVKTTDLRILLPQVNWSPRQSGYAVPTQHTKTLHDIWEHAIS